MTLAMIMMMIIYDHYAENDDDLYDNGDNVVDDDYYNVTNWKKMIFIYYNQNSESFVSVAQNEKGKVRFPYPETRQKIFYLLILYSDKKASQIN